MLYVAQVISYTGILYVVYILFLRNRPIHSFNRLYLLLASVLPVLIPFIKIPSFASYWQDNEVMNFSLPEITVGSEIAPQVDNTIDVAVIIYAMVAVIFFVVMAIKYTRLQRMAKRSEQQAYGDYTLLLNTGYGPGSWCKYIVLPEADVHETIVQHEAAHLRLRHSADLLFINLLQAVLWPNLFLYAIKKELRQVHEFQADAAIDVDAKTYGELLLANTFSTCTLPFTHSFNIHPLKRRIMMLKKRKSPTAIVFGAIAILVTGITVFNVIALQSCKAKKWTVERTEPLSGEELVGVTMPKFGNQFTLSEYLSDKMVYPKEAKEKGIEGKIMVKFVVDKDGRVKDVQVVSKNANPLLAKAAVDVVSNMPDWTPGEKNGEKVPIYYMLPFNFKLDTDSTISEFTGGGIQATQVEHPKKDAQRLTIEDK